MSLYCYTYNLSCVVLWGRRPSSKGIQSQCERGITDYFMPVTLENVKLSEKLFRLKASHFLFPSHEDDPAQSRWLCCETLLHKMDIISSIDYWCHILSLLPLWFLIWNLRCDKIISKTYVFLNQFDRALSLLQTMCQTFCAEHRHETDSEASLLCSVNKIYI